MLFVGGQGDFCCCHPSPQPPSGSLITYSYRLLNFPISNSHHTCNYKIFEGGTVSVLSTDTLQDAWHITGDQ